MTKLIAFKLLLLFAKYNIINSQLKQKRLGKKTFFSEAFELYT